MCHESSFFKFDVNTILAIIRFYERRRGGEMNVQEPKRTLPSLCECLLLFFVAIE
jgi:hypothetical protein